MPVQQQTTACSARPSATSRAAASAAQAQSSRSASDSAPCGSGSWPRRAQLLDDGVGDARALVGGHGDPHGGQRYRHAGDGRDGARASEQELFAVGARLAAALPAPSRNPLKALDDKAMELASQDAELKAALFRFVDVVPACRSLDDLARHLTGFLGEVETPPPPIGVAMRMGNTKAGRTALGAAAAAGVQAHGAPLHRRREPEGRARRAARPVEGRRRLLRRPARRGDRHPGRGQRYAERCAEALDTLAEAPRRWPARAAARARLAPARCRARTCR